MRVIVIVIVRVVVRVRVHVRETRGYRHILVSMCGEA
ncbi:hypothetical protein predicted by Glimmer/Critica [Sorangium cellulosum So ce56]|uniref:Uncharacterized protein n=1 Tax=Sorangium cellulosum (strain So ce56) TaxID=448385 RepID=A9F794_SORC5|nr:hypothetical protein predicted by Glimmer/Critica [Sorangium cellulosum So ce56]